MDVSKASNHGLTIRPTSESVDDVLDWYEREQLAEREDWTHGLPPNRGLSPGCESYLVEEHLGEHGAEG